MKERKPMTAEKALDRLSALCAQAEICSGDVDDKMKRWGLGEADRYRVLATLKKEGFVDDRRYAEAFVSDKLKFNGWGRAKIAMAMLQKGIAREVANDALDQVAEEAYVDVLYPLLKQKYPTIKAESDYERSMKLLRFAAGRGFTVEQVRSAIDQHPDIVGDES